MQETRERVGFSELVWEKTTVSIFHWGERIRQQGVFF